MPTSRVLVLVRVAWFVVFMATLGYAAFIVSSWLIYAPPLPKHATSIVATTRPSYEPTDLVQAAATITGDTDLALVEVAVEVIAPSGEVIRLLVPSEPRTHVSPTQPLTLQLTWDQRDSAGRTVTSGLYEFRLRVFFSPAAGAGASFTSAKVQINGP